MTNNKRPWHYLRKNAANDTPQTVVYVDTESERVRVKVGGSWVERQRFMLGTAARTLKRDDGGPRLEWLDFYDPMDFWGWLAELHVAKRSVWLVAHNAGFDLTMLRFWELLDNGYYVLAGEVEVNMKRHGKRRWEKRPWEGLYCDEDPPTIIICRHGRHTLTIVDSMNYLPVGIGELGLWLGKPKLPMPGEAAELEDWTAYCARDTQILMDSMSRVLEWWRKNDLGHWRFTAPGLGMAAFRHRFMRHPIAIEAQSEATALERSAIAAGECRAFFVGGVTVPGVPHDGELFFAKHPKVRWREGPVYVLDVTSLYPAVMQGRWYPTKRIAWKAPGDVADIVEWQKRLCLIAKVRIDSDEETYPVYAEKERWWARGKFVTALCGPELARAVELGHVLEVLELAAYAPGKIFNWFVPWFWGERQKALAAGDKVMSQFLKWVMNGLAGKFGQQTPSWQEAPDVPAGVRWGSFARVINGEIDPRKHRAIAGWVQRQEAKEETQNSMPAIEAFINSYARDWMRTARAIAGPANVLYQQTDSLHVVEDGYAKLRVAGLVADNELGKFHLERVVKSAEYRGENDYTHGAVNYVAGLNKNALRKGKGEYEVTTFPSLREIVAGEPSPEILVRPTPFFVGRLHARGVLEKDGTVRPAVVHGARVVAPQRSQREVEETGRRKSKSKRQSS